MNIKKIIHNTVLKLVLMLTAIIQISVLNLKVQASEDYITQWENRKNQPIESDSYEGWPVGPKLGAGSAILLEIKTGTILYAKNIHDKMYPASTTKILSTLIGIENSQLDEDVLISREAVFSIEKGSSNVGLDPGEVITVEQCLYAILVGSANEATNALGEHVGGSIPEFVELMNKKAAELGCENSHFVTTNGLHDPEHYTTAYDLAQIGRAFFNNEMLCKISSTPRYYIPPSPTQPDEDLYINTHNQLLFPGGKYNMDYIVGSKTGYTSNSRQTLVSCAEKDGLKLICVVMKEESPHQFEETIKLFDWGFENFKKINISDNETTYNVDEQDFFQEENDVFGGSARLIDIDKDDYVVVPITAAFKYLESSISFNQTDKQFAVINYTYHDRPVGKAGVAIAPQENSMAFDFTKGPSVDYINENEADTGETKKVRAKVIYIDVRKLLIRVILISALLLVLFNVHTLMSEFSFSRKGSNKISEPVKRTRRIFRRRHKSPFDDYDL